MATKIFQLENKLTIFKSKSCNIHGGRRLMGQQLRRSRLSALLRMHVDRRRARRRINHLQQERLGHIRVFAKRSLHYRPPISQPIRTLRLQLATEQLKLFFVPTGASANVRGHLGFGRWDQLAERREYSTVKTNCAHIVAVKPSEVFQNLLKFRTRLL